MQDIKNYNLEELRELLVTAGYSRFLAKQLFNWMYRRRCEDFNLMSDVPRAARVYLADNFYFSKISLVKKEVSLDKTEKFLFSLEDKALIEAVLIYERERVTLCLSSQVGCKFNCKFCLSGQSGFNRNLKASEIINQYLAVSDSLTSKKVTNIVFMGVGEPLDNFDNLIKAIKILVDHNGLMLAQCRISISTCGLAPEIEKLADLKLGVKLSISLHAPTDEVRDKIMPVNKKYPLKELVRSVKYFAAQAKRSIIIEYVLIDGLNVSKDLAIKLVNLLKGIDYKLNLIPYNKSSDKFQKPDVAAIEDFKNELTHRKIFYTIRKSKGDDISAACGQLRAKFNET